MPSFLLIQIASTYNTKHQNLGNEIKDSSQSAPFPSSQKNDPYKHVYKPIIDK